MAQVGGAGERRIVVMGVAGSGKTTVGTAIAERLGLAYLDADQAHPPGNVAKMSAGVPLDDADRWPWLARLRHELRGGDIVVTCSALARRYRDVLRGAGPLRFVYLHLDDHSAVERVAGRRDHFMTAGMVASQFAALEAPEGDEGDVVTVDASVTVDEVISAALAAAADPPAVTAVAPLLAAGGPQMAIDGAELDRLLDRIAAAVADRGARRVLLVPPDQTRLHSRAGAITVGLLDRLEAAAAEVGVLPALGTHAAMDEHDVRLMFGDRLAHDRPLVHDWQAGLRTIGEISAAEVAVVSGGRFAEPVPVAVDEHLLNGWDLVVSIGQVLPHEVIGMANFTKNLIIGCGGAATIHRSHFLGAVCDMETIMGEPMSPVRDVVDAAFDRFLSPLVDVLFVLTVMEETEGAVVHRGLYAGFGGSVASGGAAYRAAAELAEQVDITTVPQPFRRVACWLDPHEFRTTWLGNKAIYRTRMAVADGGEVIVLAPGVRRFGEDGHIDQLIRRHGYRGTPATLAAVGADPELAASLGTAAHLVHGSSEGRFRIVYCTDPDSGGLTEQEVRSVGYEWRSLPAELARLGVGPATVSGWCTDAAGTPFEFIANPALGLWRCAR